MEIKSHYKSSSFQRRSADAVKELVNEAIAEKLDTKDFPSSVFRFADMGFFLGPQTFSAAHNILKAIELRYRSQGSNPVELPEFQVFFTNHPSNNFNNMFTSFPPDRQYYAMGVPGSLYSRLFPKSTLHLVCSSYTLQWLSQMPEEIAEESSPAWNKGRISYSNACVEVVKAYSDRYAKDMEIFLDARAQEVVPGGLMMLLVPGRPNEASHSQVSSNMILETLGSCLMNMAKMGIIDEDDVDEFNVPIYNPCPQELKEAVERNGSFTIERIECLPQEQAQGDLSARARVLLSNMRASIEGLIRQQFGDVIVDYLFYSLSKKLVTDPVLESGLATDLFVFLRRRKT